MEYKEGDKITDNNVRLDRAHYRKINKESKDGKDILRIVRRSYVVLSYSSKKRPYKIAEEIVRALA